MTTNMLCVVTKNKIKWQIMANFLCLSSLVIFCSVFLLLVLLYFIVDYITCQSCVNDTDPPCKCDLYFMSQHDLNCYVFSYEVPSQCVTF